MDDLQGLTILVTRPQAQAVPWADALSRMGANVTVAPLLEIVPVAEASQIQAIKNCILDFDHFQKAIFVSQNAVAQGVDWIGNYWPQLPMRVAFFAVGETTAKQLKARGFNVSDLAQSQTGDMTSETLLQSPSLQQVTGEKIVIFRGVGGRSHLGDTLTERGAKVSYCELYERSFPLPSRDIIVQWFGQLKSHAVVTLHSGEALEYFCNVIRSLEKNESGAFENIHVLVPSQRIMELATDAGFKKVFVAQNATDACMTQGLIDLKRNLTKV